jgi:hypothetical protein
MPLQVDNTNAEGRLTLADALVYAYNQGVDKVIRCFCADDMVYVCIITIWVFFYESYLLL